MNKTYKKNLDKELLENKKKLVKELLAKDSVIIEIKTVKPNNKTSGRIHFPAKLIDTEVIFISDGEDK